MGSTFTTMPGVYDQTSILGTKKSLPTYIQFVPGIVVKVTTGDDSISHEGVSKRIGSIIAMPHFGDKGIRKPSLAGEEFRYYPLLRGMQDVPTPGDPVLLTDLVKVFSKNNVDPSKPIVFTCGSGMTACVLGMAYSLISGKNAMLYDGSWSEYGKK